MHTVWVPEYARSYLENINRPYVEDDLLSIAHGQIESEDKLLPSASNILVCDTDLYVLKVWSEHKYHRCDKWIMEQIAKRKYDLYLLTYIDIDWGEDPQREYPSVAMRTYFYNIYLDLIQNSNVPWVDIRGDENTRLKNALRAINNIL